MTKDRPNPFIRTPQVGARQISRTGYLLPVATALNQRSFPQALDQRAGQAQFSQGSGAVARQLLVVSEAADTITCSDPADPAITIAIAKPPTLRGNIATRPGNGGLTQEIFPAYAVNDPIWAIVTQTGVVGTIYIDLNIDARQWAEPPAGG